MGEVQLSNTDVIQNPRLVSIDGVQETNYTIQPPLDDDPFEHIRDKPFFSFERLIYNDPWFHEDSHEPYNSPPRRGYITGDDPLESRFMYSIPNYATAGVLLLTLALFAIGDKDFKNTEATEYEHFISSKFVHETLEAKNAKLNELRARENALLKGLSASVSKTEEKEEE